MTQTLDDYDDDCYDCPICGATNEGGDNCICLQDDPPPCGCKYCYCAEDTIAGETCDNCSRGIHLGEVGELADAMRREQGGEVWDEAVDVGNLAMMILITRL